VFFVLFDMFLIGMDLRGSVLLNIGCRLLILRNDKYAVLMHFGVKKSNSTKIDLAI